MLLRKLCCVSCPGVQTHELDCLIFLCLGKIIPASFHLCSVLPASEVPQVAYPSGSLQPSGHRAPRKAKGAQQRGCSQQTSSPHPSPHLINFPHPTDTKCSFTRPELVLSSRHLWYFGHIHILAPSSSQDPSKGLRRGLQPPPAAAPTAATWPWVCKSFPSAPAHLLSLGCEQ